MFEQVKDEVPVTPEKSIVAERDNRKAKEENNELKLFYRRIARRSPSSLTRMKSRIVNAHKEEPP